MADWSINTNVKMIWVIFIFLFMGDMIIFVITNPIYIRDRNSDDIDVGKLLLATFIAASFGTVIIWLISLLFAKKSVNPENPDPVFSLSENEIAKD